MGLVNEQAAVQLQLDEAAAASIGGDAVGERAAAAADEQSLRSALECMDEIEEQISGFQFSPLSPLGYGECAQQLWTAPRLRFQLAFFLDYDGTLTPIVENPSAAKLHEEPFPPPRNKKHRRPAFLF